MFFTKQPHGVFIRLDNMREHGMDCAFGKYEDNTEVNSWHLHRGGNQLFMVNHDKTISPCFAPNKYWGFKNGNLRLVGKTANEKLVFDKLLPTNQGIFNIPLTFGNDRAIVYSGSNKQWPHGQETHLGIGSADKAARVFLDS